jgi:hypothetical protein
MRCMCESGHCPHHHGDPRDVFDVEPCDGVATGLVTMSLVGPICGQCAAEVSKTAPEYVHRKS